MTIRDDPIQKKRFGELKLDDPFFDSLKNSYAGFDNWVQKKASAGEEAYVVVDQRTGRLSAMLYLKDEEGIDESTIPALTIPRLKVGTFKVGFNHHTSVGKRLLAVALRRFAESNYEYIYVTMFDNANTQPLRGLMEEYGFVERAIKRESGEKVLFKCRPQKTAMRGPSADFPFIDPDAGNDYLLSIFPEYHDRLYGDTQLRTQYGEPIKDNRVVNTIEKVYLSGARNGNQLSPGDHIVSYRTAPPGMRAYYASVVSSVGTITEIHNISEFPNVEEFLSDISGRSVFTEEELRRFYLEKKYPWIINFLYNFRFDRYPNRQKLLDEGVISEDARIVCTPLSKMSFKQILKLGAINESYVLD